MKKPAIFQNKEEKKAKSWERFVDGLMEEHDYRNSLTRSHFDTKSAYDKLDYSLFVSTARLGKLREDLKSSPSKEDASKIHAEISTLEKTIKEADREAKKLKARLDKIDKIIDSYKEADEARFQHLMEVGEQAREANERDAAMTQKYLTMLGVEPNQESQGPSSIEKLADEVIKDARAKLESEGANPNDNRSSLDRIADEIMQGIDNKNHEIAHPVTTPGEHSQIESPANNELTTGAQETNMKRQIDEASPEAKGNTSEPPENAPPEIELNF